MPLDFLVPFPQKVGTRRRSFSRPRAARVIAPRRAARTAAALAQDLRALAGMRVSSSAVFRVRLSVSRRAARPEGYRLRLGPRGAEIRAADEAGLYYGIQTLLQVLVLGDLSILGAGWGWPDNLGFWQNLARYTGQ